MYQRVVADDKPGEWIKLKTITNSSVREFTVALTKGKVYEFVVTARNDFGESLKEPEKLVRVMVSGAPAAVQLNDIPSEVTENTITLKWNAPENHGRKIKQYTVYKRMVVDDKPGEWIKLKTITDISVRELTVELEKGKEYEFVVTATNVHGESKIEEANIKRVMAKGGMFTVLSFYLNQLKFSLLYCFNYSTLNYLNTMTAFYTSRYSPKKVT